jgi:carbon storage regulator
VASDTDASRVGYLVLTRRVGEAITIGDDVEVSVAAVGRGTVRLAIRAPRERRVKRTGGPSSPS